MVNDPGLHDLRQSSHLLSRQIGWDPNHMFLNPRHKLLQTKIRLVQMVLMSLNNYKKIAF